MSAPFHIKLLSLDEDMFARSTHQKLARLMKRYIDKFKTPPTKDSLVSFADDVVKNEKDIEEFSDAILVMDSLPEILPQEFSYYMDKAENYFIGRSIYDLAGMIKEKFEEVHEADYRVMRKDLLSYLLTKGADEEKVRRGFIYQSAKERWEHQKKLQTGEIKDELMPFGMKAVDDLIKGMRRTFVTLLYSKTAGGKSRTKINVAYNNALAGRNVLYFSLEMAYELVCACFDSRMAMIDSQDIIYGKLNNTDLKKYREALKQQIFDELGIYLVDIPNRANAVKLYEEYELYRATTNLKPHLICLDYANLMEPMAQWRGRSEKYDFLFDDLHKFARTTDTALLTSVMESRERSKMDKKKKSDDEDDMGVEGIGLSNYIAPHCEIVARIVQPKDAEMTNSVYLNFEKHRYGKAFEQVQLLALWANSYVGDRLIPGSGKSERNVTIKKLNKK
jgi:replicative DNA helicase